MLPTILLIAGLFALALLVVLYWRTAQQIARLKAEAERLRVVQRDLTTDVRSRLEEGARTWESVEHEVRPRLDQLEPSVADITATLEEHLPGMGEARERLIGLGLPLQCDAPAMLTPQRSHARGIFPQSPVHSLRIEAGLVGSAQVTSPA